MPDATALYVSLGVIIGSDSCESFFSGSVVSGYSDSMVESETISISMSFCLLSESIGGRRLLTSAVSMSKSKKSSSVNVW